MNAAAFQTLHDLIGANLRRDLDAAFLSAMRGTGWGVLEHEPPAGRPADTVAWALAKADLYFLQADFDAAVAVIDEVAEPALEREGWAAGTLSAVRAVVEENRMIADLQFGRSGDIDHARRTRHWDRERLFEHAD